MSALAPAHIEQAMEQAKLKPSTRSVVRMLAAAGSTGLHTQELREPEFGGHADPSKRVSEAIRDGGFVIERIPEKRHGSLGKRFVFISAPTSVESGAGQDPSPGAAPGGVTAPPGDNQGRSASRQHPPGSTAPSSVHGDTTGAESLPDGQLFELDDFKPEPKHDRMDDAA